MDQSKDEASAPDFTALAFRFKLGVAVAIIRSKPVNKTLQQHTESLIARFQYSIQDWEKKLQNAQREIVTLKQQLSLSQAGAVREVENIFPTPESQEPEDLAAARNTICSNISVLGSSADPDLLQCLHNDAAFLSSVSRLQACSKFGTFQGKQLLRDTIIQGVNTMAVSLGEKRGLVTSPVFTEMITQILRVTDKQKFVMDKDVKACFQKLFSTLQDTILKTDSLNEMNHSRLHALQGILVHLADSQWLPLVLLEVESLLATISTWCQQTREARQTGCGPPAITESENIILIISVLDTVVKGRENLFRGADVVCRDIVESLDSCLLHLVTSWPLLARILWQISFTLQQCSAPPQPFQEHQDDW